MKVEAFIVHEDQTIRMLLTPVEEAQLAKIFELGVNVGPNTPQTINVTITTPGWEE